MDRELSALRTGRKLSDRQGNENLSVKNLIASIEHQVIKINFTLNRTFANLWFCYEMVFVVNFTLGTVLSTCIAIHVLLFPG